MSSRGMNDKQLLSLVEAAAKRMNPLDNVNARAVTKELVNKNPELASGGVTRLRSRVVRVVGKARRNNKSASLSKGVGNPVKSALASEISLKQSAASRKGLQPSNAGLKGQKQKSAGSLESRKNEVMKMGAEVKKKTAKQLREPKQSKELKNKITKNVDSMKKLKQGPTKLGRQAKMPGQQAKMPEQQAKSNKLSKKRSSASGKKSASHKKKVAKGSGLEGKKATLKLKNGSAGVQKKRSGADIKKVVKRKASKSKKPKAGSQK